LQAVGEFFDALSDVADRMPVADAVEYKNEEECSV